MNHRYPIYLHFGNCSFYHSFFSWRFSPFRRTMSETIDLTSSHTLSLSSNKRTKKKTNRAGHNLKNFTTTRDSCLLRYLLHNDFTQYFGAALSREFILSVYFVKKFFLLIPLRLFLHLKKKLRTLEIENNEKRKYS